MRKLILCAFMAVFIFGAQHISASDSESRLKALRPFNVKKNAYRLIRTKSCPGCYLVNAKLSKQDLTNANLKDANLVGATFRKSTLYNANLGGAKIAGADFSGAQWVDGSICMEGSIGQCLRKMEE